MGSERVFGFGSPAAGSFPYAELLTEVRLVDGRFMASEPHFLDQGPEPGAARRRGPTPWLDPPTATSSWGTSARCAGIVAVTAVATVRRGWSKGSGATASWWCRTS